MLAAVESTGRIDEVEDCFHFIDSYRSSSDVFLGDFIVAADAGDYLDLTGFVTNADTDDFMEKYREILTLCGQGLLLEHWSDPKLYLINQMW